MRKPNVMELDDVRTADFACLEYDGNVWDDCAVHYRPGSVYIGFTTPENMTMNLVECMYGCTWRCWTEYPEESDRMGVRWND